MFKQPVYGGRYSTHI